ncbi:MAG: MFS transporter [Gammaproteobacteria bacterium]|nr:MFS transporter [Gammaproteobacteria bacterium]
MKNTIDINSTQALTAACGNGVSGVMIFALLPMLLGVSADHLDLTELQAGMLASAYFSSYALVTAVSIFWLRRYNWRSMTFVSIAIMAVSLAAIVLIESYQTTLLSLLFCGIGAAVLHTLGYAIISDRREKDRDFAIKLVPEQVVPAALLILLSLYFPEYLNFNTLFLCLLGILGCHMFLARGVPSGIRSIQQQAKPALSNGISLGLIAMFISFTGFAGLWAFLERIARNGGMDIVLTGQLISIGLISSAVGPAIAAFIADKYGRSLPLIISTLMAILPLILFINVTPGRYAMVMAVLPTAWFFANVYFCSVISEHDQSGRMIGLIPFSLACGALVGPGLFGWVIDGYGYVASYGLCAILFAIGTALILFLNQSKRVTNNV